MAKLKEIFDTIEAQIRWKESESKIKFTSIQICNLIRHVITEIERNHYDDNDS